MRCYLFFFGILLFILSCTGKPGMVTEDIERISYLDLTDVTDLQDVADDHKPVITDVVSDIRYIPLETTKESLIANIGKIQLDSGLYFIFDSQQLKLLVFDSLGRFRNTIGRQGNGPGEYIHLYSFYLDRNRKQIGILDNYKRKTLIYDYRGNHLHDIEYAEEVLFPNASFMSSDGVVLFHYSIPDGYMESKYEYQLLRESNGSYDVLGDFSEYRFKNPARYGAVSGVSRSFFWSKERTLLASHFSNVIYALKGDTITPTYRVDTPKSLAEASFFDSNRDQGYHDLLQIMTKQNLFTGINKILETPQYLLLLLENRYTCLWDKKSEMGVCFEWTFDRELNNFGRLMESAFHAVDGDRIIGFGSALTYIEKKEEIEGGDNDRLKNLVHDLTEESNPVILVYTLKTDVVESFSQRD